MTFEGHSGYRFLGAGEGLTLEVSGPTWLSCLARAVEGFGAQYADVHPSVVGSARSVRIGETRVLTGLLDACLGLLRAGSVPLTAIAAMGWPGGWTVDLELAAGRGTRVHTDPPGRIEWTCAKLEHRDGGWLGRVIGAPC
ncbi:MAG: hypothetical protein ACT4PW_03615 [Acidimicrobiia bacterium]